MKTMTCKQLGGACEREFQASSFERIAEMSRAHGMDMFKKQDQAHLDAMKEMQKRMQNPEALDDWYQSKRKEFEALPEDE